MTVRWKLNPRQTGLRAVGAGPRGYELHDGSIVLMWIQANGGGWRRPQEGWYWYGLEANTSSTPVATIEEAKAQARAWYEKHKEAA